VKEFIEELGGFEFDESYFGTRKVRSRGSRGAVEKPPAFRLLK
jgi:hypothetical protein